MGTFDVKFAAYERAMQQNNYFGLQGDARGEQLVRYSVALQNKETKIANRQAGRTFARELAMERKALAQTEQAALIEGLAGTTTSASVAQVQQPIATVNPVQTESRTPDKIKVHQKIKVGTARTGFKYYLIDKEGNTYQVDRKTYRATKKGKRASIAGATTVDTTSPKVARKVRNASGKAQKLSGKTQKAKINLVTDPQAYHNQQQAMYNKLFGMGEQVPMHNYNLVTDPQAYHNQQQAMYNKLFGMGEQVPMHNYNLVTDPQAYHNQQQDMYNKLFNTPESRIMEVQGDVRRLEEKLASNTQKMTNLTEVVNSSQRQIASLESAVSNNARTIGNLEHTVAQNKQVIGGMEQTIARQGEEVSKLTQKLAKTNKKIALAVGIATGIATAAAGVIGYIAGKNNNESKVSNTVENKKAEQSKGDEATIAKIEEETQPTSTVESKTSVEAPVAQQPQEENVETTEAEKPVTTDFVLNENGEYLVQKGDSFWKIAEEYLKDKYENEPEKFENLNKIQRDSMVQLEAERIMKQNNYWYDENHNFSVPMLNQNIKIAIEQKLDQAA